MAVYGSKHILIIEDEEALGRMMSWQLEAHGYSVRCETRGTEGLAYAAEHRPDLVILDLMLPDLHGHYVCRMLRKICQPWELPVLMLTAMDRPIDRLRGFAHGAHAYLTKPYTESELLRTVRYLLAELDPAEVRPT